MLVPPPPTQDEKIDGMYRILSEEPRRRDAAELAAKDRHRLLFEKIGALESKVDDGFKHVDQRFRGIEARVATLEDKHAAASASARSFSPTGIKKVVQDEISHHDLEVDAKTMRALRGGGWGIVAKVATAVALLALALLGDAMLRSAMSRGGNQTNIVTPAGHP